MRTMAPALRGVAQREAAAEDEEAHAAQRERRRRCARHCGLHLGEHPRATRRRRGRGRRRRQRRGRRRRGRGHASPPQQRVRRLAPPQPVQAHRSEDPRDAAVRHHVPRPRREDFAECVPPRRACVLGVWQRPQQHAAAPSHVRATQSGLHDERARALRAPHLSDSQLRSVEPGTRRAPQHQASQGTPCRLCEAPVGCSATQRLESYPEHSQPMDGRCMNAQLYERAADRSRAPEPAGLGQALASWAERGPPAPPERLHAGRRENILGDVRLSAARRRIEGQ